MPASLVSDPLDFDGDQVIRPCEVKAPSFGVGEVVLTASGGQVGLREPKGEGFLEVALGLRGGEGPASRPDPVGLQERDFFAAFFFAFFKTRR